MRASTSIRWLNGAPTIKSSLTRPKQPTLVFFARIVSLINPKRGLFQTPFVSFSPRNRKPAFTFECSETIARRSSRCLRMFPSISHSLPPQLMRALEPKPPSWCSSVVPATASTPPATNFPTHGGSAPHKLPPHKCGRASRCLPYSFFLIAPEENDGQNLAAPTP